MKKPVSRWIAEVQHDENGDAMVIFRNRSPATA